MTLATVAHDPAAIMEQVMLAGDLSRLTAQQRVAYYMRVCESLGLNPATKPFDYISLQGRLTLYARRDATDQLRKRDNISITITARERMDDVYVVTARATTPDQRTDEAIGAVPLIGLKGEALANAMMKCETKAKRRVTLSICGLGFTDESEVDSIPGAQRIEVSDSGEIIKDVHVKAIAPASSKQASAPVSKPATPGVTDAQRRRLFAIAREHQVPSKIVKEYLANKHGIKSSKELDRSQYDDVCAWLEAQGRDDEDDIDIDVGDGFPDDNGTFGDVAGSPL